MALNWKPSTAGDLIRAGIEVMEDDIQHLVGELITRDLKKEDDLEEARRQGEISLRKFDGLSLALAVYIEELEKDLASPELGKVKRKHLTITHRRLVDIFEGNY